MSEFSGYTPGPWRVHAVREHDGGGEQVVSDKAMFELLPFPVVSHGAINGRSVSECDANTALIANAPRMLAALQEIRRYVKPWITCDNTACRIDEICLDGLSELRAD